MVRQNALQHTYVRYIPEKLVPGVIYISKKYHTATHLCCCGCELKVVTPLNPAKWSLTDHGQSVSLFPSIGNWSFTCKSHYWIDHGRIRWAGKVSAQQITNVRRYDRLDAKQHSNCNESLMSRVGEFLKRWFGGN